VHIVTKILIVFGAILTILLSALTISYAASETRVREEYKNVVAQKDRAQKEVQIAQAESSEKRSALAIAKDAAESAKADLEQQIKRLQQERAELIAKAKEAELAADAAKNQVAGLGESAKVNSTLIKSLTDEVSSLRKAQLVPPSARPTWSIASTTSRARSRFLSRPLAPCRSSSPRLASLSSRPSPPAQAPPSPPSRSRLWVPASAPASSSSTSSPPAMTSPRSTWAPLRA
jgi:hypothetical protein